MSTSLDSSKGSRFGTSPQLGICTNISEVERGRQGMQIRSWKGADRAPGKGFQLEKVNSKTEKFKLLCSIY